jgi:murein L,D-transpeptidase YcbB/YkuD
LTSKKASAAERDDGDAASDVSSGASKAGAAASKTDPALLEAQKIIQNAATILGRGDPAEIETAAKKIEKWEPDVAKDWRAFAKLIRDAQAKNEAAPSVTNVVKTAPGKKPTTVKTSETAVVTEPEISASSQALASRFALMLQTTKPGKEDRAVVSMFQSDNGLKADGLYGRNTAVMLARKYRIVPPRPPVSWGTSAGGYKSVAPDKQLYRQAMLDLARTDGARADEWTAAAAAVKG